MKKFVTLACLLFFVFSCEEILIAPDYAVLKRVSKIETEFPHRTASETFTYDEHWRLVSVHKDVSITTDDLDEEELISFYYSGDERFVQAKTYRLFHKQNNYRIDSFEYASNNELSKLFRWYINDGGEPYLSLTQLYSYEEGRITQIENVYANPQHHGHGSFNRYTWDKSYNNIIKIESWRDDYLMHEVDLEYDRSYNFKKHSPYFSDWLSNHSNNNVISADYSDHSGLILLACDPCLYSYAYDDSNHPITIDNPIELMSTQTVFYIEGN